MDTAASDLSWQILLTYHKQADPMYTTFFFPPQSTCCYNLTSRTCMRSQRRVKDRSLSPQPSPVVPLRILHLHKPPTLPSCSGRAGNCPALISTLITAEEKIRPAVSWVSRCMTPVSSSTRANT